MPVNKRIFKTYFKQPVVTQPAVVAEVKGPDWVIRELKWVKMRPASANERAEDASRPFRRIKPLMRMRIRGTQDTDSQCLTITAQYRGAVDGWRFNVKEANGKDCSGTKGTETFFSITLPQRLRNAAFVATVLAHFEAAITDQKRKWVF